MAIATIAVVIMLCLSCYHVYSKRACKLPPSINALPLLGNIRDLPPKGMPEFRHLLRHKDICGPISSLSVFGYIFIILHDRQAVQDILVNKSSKTSGRPSFEFSSRLCGYEQLLAMKGYGDSVRRHKKMLHQHLGSKAAVADLDGVRDLEIRRYLLNLLEEPEALTAHIKLASSKILLLTTYGYTPRENGDPLVELNEKIIQNALQAAIPGKWLVDAVPLMKYLPSGFPGSGFQEMARLAKAQLMAAVQFPYDFVQGQMASGKYRPSFVSRLIQDRSTENAGYILSSMDTNDIIWSAAVLYLGGVDTSVATLKSFFLAMTLFPNVQTEAQAELDSIVGCRRLPAVSDRKNLPFVNAMISEIHRWWTTVPLGLPHALTETIDYKGYTLPKGAVVLPAIWWFMHDPNVYAEPERFDPTRFLEPRNEPDPRRDVFGYGRRACPGQYLADEHIFLTVAQTLSMFSIEKKMKSSHQTGAEFEFEIKPGLINHIDEFACSITPRGPKHEDLIREVESQLKEESDSLGAEINDLQNFTLP